MAIHEKDFVNRAYFKLHLIFLLISFFALGINSAIAVGDLPGDSFDHDFKKWDRILNEVVVVEGFESRVRYGALQKSPQELDSFLSEIQAVSRKAFDGFSEKQRLAFLINTYNAFTLKLIVNNYPVKSIKDLGSIFRSAWKRRFFQLFGEPTHLDNVEHDMVRKWFNEPRIHFALVCAARGCPALANRAFTEKNLEAMLETASLNFLKDKTRNRYKSSEMKLEISSIFKWYRDDFEKDSNTLFAFLAPRITENEVERAAIHSGKASVSFLAYDWSLNDQK